VGRTAPVADLTARAVERMPAPALPAGLSMETGRRHEDTPHLAGRAASVPARSAAISMADRPGAFHHAEAAVWVAAHVAGASAEADTVAEAAAMVAAGIGNRSVITFSISLCELEMEREAICGERT